MLIIDLESFLQKNNLVKEKKNVSMLTIDIKNFCEKEKYKKRIMHVNDIETIQKAKNMDVNDIQTQNYKIPQNI